jgi:hypothetical protein
MKVVINNCYGGFSISLEAARHMAAAGSKRAQADVASHEAEIAAFREYRDHGKKPANDDRGFSQSIWDISIKYGGEPKFHGYGYVDGMEGSYERHDPLLVAAVEALGEKASGEVASLKVVEIPDGIEYDISEYDGMEHVAERHRTWS